MSVSIDPEGAETNAIHHLVDFQGLTALEVGCGDGRLTWRYARKTSSVLALDVNERKISQAIADTPGELRSKVVFKVADINDFDLPQEGFDVTILSHSL